MTTRSRAMATAAIASTSSWVRPLPQGLWGEFRITSRVRSVTSEASSAGSIRNRLASRSGTGPGEGGDRLVHREPGVGVEDLVAGLAQGQDGEEHDRLGPRGDHHPVRAG